MASDANEYLLSYRGLQTNSNINKGKEQNHEMFELFFFFSLLSPNMFTSSTERMQC